VLRHPRAHNRSTSSCHSFLEPASSTGRNTEDTATTESRQVYEMGSSHVRIEARRTTTRPRQSSARLVPRPEPRRPGAFGHLRG
jgi:hypothetical protein